MFYERWSEWKKQENVEKTFVYYECEKNKKNLVDYDNVFASLIKILSKYEPKQELEKKLILWLRPTLKQNKIMPYYFMKDYVSAEGYFPFSGISMNLLDKTGIEIGTIIAYEMIKGTASYERLKRNKKNIALLKQSGFIDRLLEYEEDRLSAATPIEEIMFKECKKLEKKYPITVKVEHKLFINGGEMYTHALDVAIFRKNETLPFLDIETDGLKFHKSFNSMQADRERDRRLLLNDILTMRYTSREVFSKIKLAIKEIETIIKKNVNNS